MLEPTDASRGSGHGADAGEADLKAFEERPRLVERLANSVSFVASAQAVDYVSSAVGKRTSVRGRHLATPAIEEGRQVGPTGCDLEVDFPIAHLETRCPRAAATPVLTGRISRNHSRACRARARPCRGAGIGHLRCGGRERDCMFRTSPRHGTRRHHDPY
jgi:hypothetical protein